MTLLNLLPGRTALLSGALLLNCALGVSAKKVDFAREVLPILSNKCFVCHGPDTRKKDELRLDSFEAATSDRGGYRAIDPEDPGESEMLVRLHDREDPMPPRDAEKQLTEAERDILSRWVKEGGRYARHCPLFRPSGPILRREAPPRQSIASSRPNSGRSRVARWALLRKRTAPPSPVAQP